MRKACLGNMYHSLARGIIRLEMHPAQCGKTVPKLQILESGQRRMGATDCVPIMDAGSIVQTICFGLFEVV